ncbi:unnamed protein product, partial [Rotaria sp. Silwood2]
MDMESMENIEYCLGSFIDNFDNTRDQSFTFDELRQLNVT